MSTPDPVIVARGYLGDAVRRNRGEAAIKAARQELQAAKLERAIREAIDAAPPITGERREQLARLLRDGGAR